MDFFRRAGTRPARLAVLAGTFNPPTRAHVGLACAALGRVDEVLFVLPRVFPHKPYAGASFEERVEMLRHALEAEPRFSIAATGQGLFIDIARECRGAYGKGIELYFLCGGDAAERIVTWDYGRPGAIAEQLQEYQLLVSPRGGSYEPPPELAGRVHFLPLDAAYAEVSATEVRRRVRSNEPWEHLAPAEIVALVREIYGRRLEKRT